MIRADHSMKQILLFFLFGLFATYLCAQSALSSTDPHYTKMTEACKTPMHEDFIGRYVASTGLVGYVFPADNSDGYQVFLTDKNLGDLELVNGALHTGVWILKQSACVSMIANPTLPNYFKHDVQAICYGYYLDSNEKQEFVLLIQFSDRESVFFTKHDCPTE